MFIHDIADFLVNLTCKDIKPDIYSVFDSPSENNCHNNVNSEKLTILEILNAIGCRLKNLFGFVKINTTTETIDEGEAVVNVNGDEDNLNFDFAKKSNTNYDTEWIDNSGSGSTVSVNVGETLTGEPGTNASVTNSGDETNVVLNFTIPRGKTGPQGPQGEPGADGKTGPQGPAGPGVAAGGTTGQVLVKKSNTNYDTEWINPLPYVPIGGIIEWNGTGLIGAPDLSTPEKVASVYGYGTWERYGIDRVTVGAGGEYNAGSIGGEKEHTLNIAEMPSHQHQLHGWAIAISTSEGTQYAPTHPYDRYDNTNVTTRPVGEGQPHNNMPPYIGTYRYRRIA